MVHINADGRLEVFAVGSDDQVWHIWQPTWSTWAPLGSPARIAESPVATRNAGGELEFFLIDGTGRIVFLNQRFPVWGVLGSPNPQILLGPGEGQDTNGYLEVFVVGKDGALWNIQQTAQTVNQQSWSVWNSLGNPQNPPNPPVSLAGSPVIFQNQNGDLEAFSVDNFGVLWHLWQTTPGSWLNSSWEQLNQQLPKGLGKVSVAVAVLQRGRSNATTQVTVSDQATGTRIVGATVTVFDSSGGASASGVTASHGTVTITYPKCIDRETKQQIECDGTARRAGYQDAHFLTPSPV